ncbi:hypothetical protein BCR35DRAFT_355451 [Leucosporidium creatinivorum]|uniref:F-box domain-containing protein n=1 Tax=Leucosporidium creatinivorum TaxID=106004 RepID=A0A1Y2DFI5_9BASI|nr:hypothetical protein BCR35DRAFT_355451 [Leucosporidium creatinivorum]
MASPNRLTVFLHQTLFVTLIPLYLLASFFPRRWLASSRIRTPAPSRLPHKVIRVILELVDKVHHSEEAIPDYRTLTAASRICRAWRDPAQEVIYLHLLIIGDRRGKLFLSSDATARLAKTKPRRAELVALSGEMIWKVCELLESLVELSLRGDIHRHLLDGVCSCAVFGLPSLKGLKELELAIRPIPGSTMPSFALETLTLYLENRIPLTCLSALFLASKDSLRSLELHFLAREAHPDLLLKSLPLVTPNLLQLSITNTTAHLMTCLEGCTKLKTIRLQPQSTIATLRTLLCKDPKSALPVSVEELSIDSSEGGLVKRLKVILEQDSSSLPRIQLINARITAGLVAKPLIEELRSKGVVVHVA